MENPPAPAPIQKPSPLNLVLTLTSVISLALAGYFIYQNQLLSEKLQTLIKAQQAAVVTPTPTPTDETANWKTYQNSQMKIEFMHPSKMTITNVDPTGWISLRNSDPFLELDIRTSNISPNKVLANEGVSESNGWKKSPSQSPIQGIVTDIYDGDSGEAGAYPTKIFVFKRDETTYYFHIATFNQWSVVDQILSSFKFTDTNQTSLQPADFQTPAAGVCGEAQTTSVTIIVGVDNIANPRCIKVTGSNTLIIANDSDNAISINLTQYQTVIQPGKSYQFPKKLGSFLAPGVHFIGGAEIWLQ